MLLMSGLVALALSGCLRWPDAPTMEVLSGVPPEVMRTVQTHYPEAVLDGPVYRRTIDTGTTRPAVFHTLLFRDGSSDLHRAEVDPAGEVTITPARLVTDLPGPLGERFFEGRQAPAPGGHTVGRVWAATFGGRVHYEFEYATASGRGFGRIDQAGTTSSAHRLNTASTAR